MDLLYISIVYTHVHDDKRIEDKHNCLTYISTHLSQLKYISVIPFHIDSDGTKNGSVHNL